MTITAIETVHAHCRFRSRTEARYAVFLDALDEPWRYEAQGWRFSGECYLPDFWLPRLQSYLEVKGLWDTTVRKAQHFASEEIEEHPVYLAVGGIPSHRQLSSVGWWDPTTELGVISLTPGFEWSTWFPPETETVLLASESARSERFAGRHRALRRPVRSALPAASSRRMTTPA